MAPPILRPENALKRADELISVGEPQAALQSLFDYISSKRIRSADPSLIEPIVFKFLELGVELKKGKMIKDGLYQYRKNTQSSSEGLNSVGAVSRKFIDLVEKKMALERAKADEEARNDPEEEDLEGGVTPENLLISVYEQDQSVGGFNDEAVTSWLRFTWESYRTVLDLLRNNSQLEITYSGVVNRAMQFCLTYNRKNEFKRLADMLRQHLDAANYQQQNSKQYTVDLSDADTLQRYLDQRFLQVNVSVKLELWHEAFRSIEDVHHLLGMSMRPPKPSVLAGFYQNMARVFYVSSNYLLHAVALQKYYQLFLQNPNATDEEFKHHSSQFLLAVLSIQQDDLPIIGYDPILRLIGLLDLESKPTRQQMLEAAKEESIFSRADEDVKSLYNLMTTEFEVTTLKEKLDTLLPALVKKPCFEQYAVPLKNYTIRSAFINASTKFDIITLQELFNYVNLSAPFDFTPIDLEKQLLQAAMDDYVFFTMDHETQTVSFAHDPFSVLGGSNTESSSDEESQDSSDESSQEDAEPVTHNYTIRKKLLDLARVLEDVDGFTGASYVEKVKMARAELITQNNEIIASEKQAAEERARRIELERQQMHIPMTMEQVVEERQRRMKEEKETAEQRMEAEAKRRAAEKLEREIAIANEKAMRKMIMDINAKGLIYIDPEEAKDMTVEKFKKLTVDLVSKDRKELEERMKQAFKKVDHIERAYRKLQLPLWEKDAKSQKERDLNNYNKLKDMLLTKAKKEHEETVELHKRLVKIHSSYDAYKAKLMVTHKSKIEQQRIENAAKLQAAKKARIEQVRQERYQELIARREEEFAVQQRDRELKQREEEAEREREKLRLEREERMRVNREKDEAAAKQREIDAELERRLSGNRHGAPASSTGKYVPPRGGARAPASSVGSPRAPPLGSMDPAKSPGVFTFKKRGTK